jgi:hypothetical protein
MQQKGSKVQAYRPWPWADWTWDEISYVA